MDRKNITNVPISPGFFISRFLVGFLGAVLIRLQGFISLPFYTRCLVPADYGIMRLVFLTVAIVTGLFSLRLSPSFSVFSAGAKDTKTVSRNLLLALFLSFIAFVTCSFITWRIAPWILPREMQPYLSYMILLIASTILFQYVMTVFATFQLIVFRTVFDIMFSYGALALSIYLLYKGGNIASVFTAANVVGFFLVVVGSVYIFSRIGFHWKWDRELTIKYLKFSLPLIPTIFSDFVVQSIDQYFILYYHGAAMVGLYSVAVSTAFFMHGFDGALFITYSPTLYRLWDKGDLERFHKYSTKVNHLTAASMGYAVIIYAMFATWAISVLAEKSYYEAALYVPPLVLALSLAIMGGVLEKGIYAKKNTLIPLYVLMGSALTNCFFNYLLIPKWKIYGAVWATIIAYAVSFAAYVILTKKMLNIMYDFVFLLKVITAAGPLTYLCRRFFPMGVAFPVRVLGAFGISAVYLFLLIVFGCVKLEDWKFVVSFIKREESAGA